MHTRTIKVGIKISRSAGKGRGWHNASVELQDEVGIDPTQLNDETVRDVRSSMFRDLAVQGESMVAALLSEGFVGAAEIHTADELRGRRFQG